MRNLILLLLMALGMPILLYSQSEFPDPAFRNINVPNSLYLPSPQSWSFMKYGDTSTDLYTGTVSLDIPVYHYVDTDFDIPISLGYTSNGFMPGKHTGIVGLNWYLNAGGCITREIRGTPDEKGSTGMLPYHGNGFLTSSAPEYKYSDTDLLALSETEKYYRNLTFSYGDKNSFTAGIETESDIYHFRFPGHSGTFHFDGDKKLKVYNTNGNNGTYDISFDFSGGFDGTITITTGDGYEYLFGISNSEDAVEKQISGSMDYYGGDYTQNGAHEHTVVTWNLTKITAPNNRSVIYNYKESQSTYETINYNSLNSNYVVSFMQADRRMNRQHYYGYGDPTESVPKVMNIIKTTYLESISITNGPVIGFTYSPKEYWEVDSLGSEGLGSEGYPHPLSKYVQKLNKLDRITVTRGVSTILKNCKLGYTYKDHRALLEWVKIDGEGTYTMSYYLDQTLPDLLTNAIDHWGYYNGRTVVEDRTIYPVTVNGDYDEIVAYDFKDPDPTFSISGNLKRITYPTGGHTEFQYEGHDASMGVFRINKITPTQPSITPPTNAGIRASSTASSPYDYDNYAFLNHYKPYYNPVGGVRIKKIINDNGVGNITVKEYVYNTYNSYSDGTLLSFPRHYMERVGVVGTHLLNDFLTFSSNTFDRSHIGYNTVTEIFPDGSKAVYSYTNYDTNPDDYVGHNYIEMIKDDQMTLVGDPDLRRNITRSPNSRHDERGKLLRVLYYDNTDLCVKKETYRYERHNNDGYSAFVHISGDYYWSAKLFTGDYRVVSRREVEYLRNQNRIDSISTEVSFGYNNYDQIRYTKTLYNDNQGYLSYNKYLSESTYTNLKDKFKSLPLQVVNAKVINGTNWITSAARYSYNASATLPRVLDYSTANPEAPLPFIGIYVFETIPDSDYKSEIKYSNYDTKLNFQQTINKQGTPTTYLWGYGGLYLVAIIENVSYDDVSTALGGSTSPAAGLTSDQESTLRDIPNALVTTYEYNNFREISRITDPSGRVSMFSYNDTGKLESVKQGNDVNGEPDQKVIEYRYSTDKN